MVLPFFVVLLFLRCLVLFLLWLVWLKIVSIVFVILFCSHVFVFLVQLRVLFLLFLVFRLFLMFSVISIFSPGMGVGLCFCHFCCFYSKLFFVCCRVCGARRLVCREKIRLAAQALSVVDEEDVPVVVRTLFKTAGKKDSQLVSTGQPLAR